MMFTSFARRSLLQARQQVINGTRRAASTESNSPITQWYNMFGSSNIAYVGFICVGLVITEQSFGFITDSLWASANYGKTFDTIDWSKFVVDDDDDDDDDEEEEEEEEEDDE